MSNAKLRRKLETMPTPTVAAMIDLGHVHDDGGILEFSYYGYCNPGQVILQGNARTTIKERPSMVAPQHPSFGCTPGKVRMPPRARQRL